MFRDTVLENFNGMVRRFGAEPSPAAHLRQRIVDARPLRIQPDAFELILSCLDDMSQEKYLQAVVNLAPLWTDTWLEYGSGDGYVAGLVNVTDDHIRSTAFVSAPKGYNAAFSPSVFSFEIDKRTEAGSAVATPFAPRILSHLHGDARRFNDMREADCENALKLVRVMTALIALINAKEIVRIGPDLPLTRTERRRFEREGIPAPKTAVCRIDLTDLGRQELSMRRGDLVTDIEGEAATKRRMHWVRGHMFLARNGIMTFRKPHLRGVGDLVNNKVSVVAPTSDEACVPEI